MKQETRYLISDAARKVNVESHVLRYWEEELKLPIKRNELGHRYYTEEDITRFKEVKSLKEQGLQLKAIRMILKDGRLEKHVLMVNSNELMTNRTVEAPNHSVGIIAQSPETQVATVAGANESKTLRLQQLLQQMISDAVRTSTKDFVEDIKETMLKELDYQFRLQEEREENYIREKINRDEAHYQRIDEMLRKRSRKLKPEKERRLFKKS